jgi:hypothetical protein
VLVTASDGHDHLATAQSQRGCDSLDEWLDSRLDSHVDTGDRAVRLTPSTTHTLLQSMRVSTEMKSDPKAEPDPDPKAIRLSRNSKRLPRTCRHRRTTTSC